MKHKIFALVLAFTIVLTIPTYADIPKFHYTFDQALKMVMDNNLEYKALNKPIDNAYDQYEYLDKQTPSDIKYTGSMKSFIDRQVNPHVALESSYSDYQLLIMNRNNIRRNLELGLREIVIGVERAEMAAKEAEMHRRDLKNQERLLEIQYEEGLIGKNTYKNAKQKLKDNLKKLDDVNKAVDNAYHQLNVLLGREDEKDILVKLDDTTIPLNRLKLDRIKRDFMENGGTPSPYETVSLKELKEQKSITGYKHDLIKERYDKYDLDKFSNKMRDDIDDMYFESKDDFEIADNRYANALARFEKSFNDMIRDIEDLYEDIEEAKLDLVIEKENKNIYEIQYNEGLISKVEYDNLKDKTVIAENNLREIELALNMKYAELLIYSNLDRVVEK